ncbi:hypothetical protein VB618_12130 [Microvirga sp. CF3062]|uniref:hypothetical protein n=1 Tax=Microvirga sp. CF3062 TaxID=3110182 RepID=UPI002E772C26|nr:hypothetical protein [Microvirga sp. CF3062]MEE1656948.1 hypothetical protein [Microvirga sp. CF3062]
MTSTGVDPTGISAMAAGHVYQAEVKANVAAWEARNPRPDPAATQARIEAIKQKAIADGVLSPDGSSKQ